MAITIQSEGRRHYLIGDTYSIKDRLRTAGAHWDTERKAWWTSKREVADRFVTEASAQQQARSEKERAEGIKTSDSVIRGRALYQGKVYYVLAHGEKNGRKYAKLAFRDGSRVFWARDGEPVQILKRYEEPTSIDALRKYAEKAKQREEAEHGCSCRCHSSTECQCGKSGYCPVHHDGCDRCGCES